MPYAKISSVDKERLFDAYRNGEDYVQLARQLNIKRTTAYAIVRRGVENDGRIAKERGGFRGRKMDAEMLEVAVAIVEENNAFTLQQINEEMRRRLPNSPQVCVSTLSSALHGALYRMKKLETIPAERNSERVKVERYAFANWLVIEGLNRELIFSDESGFNLWTCRTRGRARIGEPAIRVVAGRRGHNLTITFAVSNERGLLKHDIIEGGVNTEK